MSIKNSELILNSDGSVYHLHLKPSDIADTIIFVGDQDRVVEVTKHFDTVDFDGRAYPVVPCSEGLETKFTRYAPSLTLTAKGFYGPQFRNSQLLPKYTLDDIVGLRYGSQSVGNIEMETAGIYGLASLLGFNAISINALLADRLNGTFSKDPAAVVERMIEECLAILCP